MIRLTLSIIFVSLFTFTQAGELWKTDSIVVRIRTFDSSGLINDSIYSITGPTNENYDFINLNFFNSDSVIVFSNSVSSPWAETLSYKIVGPFYNVYAANSTTKYVPFLKRNSLLVTKKISYSILLGDYIFGRSIGFISPDSNFSEASLLDTLETQSNLATLQITTTLYYYSLHYSIIAAHDRLLLPGIILDKGLYVYNLLGRKQYFKGFTSSSLSSSQCYITNVNNKMCKTMNVRKALKTTNQ